MADHFAEPRPGPDDLPLEVSNEDAGRLVSASRVRLIVIVVILTMLTEIIQLQYSMVAISLPKLAAAFPASGSSTSWAITILGVGGGATIAFIGKSGDLYGKKRTLLVISLIFTVGTILCALTTSWPLFLVGRGLASVSFGMNVVTYSIVRDIMPRRWIPICVGILGAGIGMSGILGPLIGGVLNDHFGWQGIFWFLVIYMAVMIPLFVLHVPESPVRAKQRLDVIGGLLLGVSIAVTLIYLSEGEGWGWGNISALAYLIGGVVGLVAFVLWEKWTPNPMIELSLLWAPRLSLIYITGFFITGFQALTNVLVSYMFQTPKKAEIEQQILAGVAAQAHQPVSVISRAVSFRGDLSYAGGFSSLQVALHIIVWTGLFTMAAGPIGGILARRIGARVPLVIGTICALAASALWVEWHTTWQDQVAIGVLYGIGSGFYFASWPNLIIDSVPVERQGITTGMFSVIAAVGSSVPIAILVSILTAHPFQMVLTEAGGKQIVSTIPQVYSNTAYSQSYLLLGVIPCAIAVAAALLLRNGRKPARGGAPVTQAEMSPTAEVSPT
jgi:MFS family permease